MLIGACLIYFALFDIPLGWGPRVDIMLGVLVLAVICQRFGGALHLGAVHRESGERFIVR